MNSVLDQLTTLIEADQQDRKDNNPQTGLNDQQRLVKLNTLLPLINSPEEQYIAAQLFNHCGNSEDLLTAYNMALTAYKSGFDKAKWLIPRTFDRHLMMQGKPQKYGTQYKLNQSTSQFELWKVDNTILDAERHQLGLPSLKDIPKTLYIDTKT